MVINAINDIETQQSKKIINQNENNSYDYNNDDVIIIIL